MAAFGLVPRRSRIDDADVNTDWRVFNWQSAAKNAVVMVTGVADAVVRRVRPGDVAGQFESAGRLATCERQPFTR